MTNAIAGGRQGGEGAESLAIPDRKAVRRAFDGAARRYEQHAVLQRQVAQAALERLQYFRLQPAGILDLGSGPGGVSRQLARRYPRARVTSCDLALSMVVEARRRRRWFRGQQFVCGDAETLPFADASFDLIFSSLMLQWCRPDAVFAEVARLLRPGGLFLFTSFGPDTLRELRAAWRAVDGASHVSDFVDMHDLGDALVRNGLGQPVLDVAHYRLTYASTIELARDLKAIGASHAARDRRRGLTSARSWRRMSEHYEQWRADGVLPATYEVVHGHGWKGEGHRGGGSAEAADGLEVPVRWVKRGNAG